MRFTDINIDEIRDATVFLDVDGTLVADRGKVATPEVAALVKKLAEHNDVYLASNGGGARTPVLAQALGVNCLPVLRKPLSHSAIRSIERRARTVVIGDKLLTDGLFAYGLKAELILLTPLREGTEVPMVRLSYALDAVASALFHGVHAIRNSLPGQYVRLMRPKQWIKNLLLLTPLFFAGAFLNPELFIAALLGLISFSAAASAGYVVNDLLDREQDRFHPKKKNRPLA